jgi:hypothetical protein
VADGHLTLFAETADGQVAGWLPGVPNLHEALPTSAFCGGSHNPASGFSYYFV